ncbi:MAG TPA: MbnP family protein, partial [Chitinophagales bacterium]|nr:MbnP family protein [Chitinophagales bacterium]
NNLSKVIFIAAIVALFIASGCKHDNNTGTTMMPVGLHLHTYIDTNEVETDGNDVYFADANGRVERLNYAQLYITTVSFHSTTKGWYTIPGSILLKRIEQEEYPIGSVPADDYDQVMFTVGLNNTLNGAAPSSYSTTGTDSVLSTNENFMYLGSGQGYKFLTLAGEVDTSAGQTGTNPIAFSYDIGGNGDTVMIMLPQESFTIAKGVPYTQYLHIVCDYGKVLQAIDMTNTANRTGTYTGTQNNAARQIWNAIINMFRYECDTPDGDC